MYCPAIPTQTVPLRSVYLLQPEKCIIIISGSQYSEHTPLHFIFTIPILGTIKWKQGAVAMKQIMRGSDKDRSLNACWNRFSVPDYF